MPEKDEEKTLEAEPKGETKEVEPEGEEKTEEPSKTEPETEEVEEEKEILEKEPPKRFPKSEQTAVEKQVGYLTRKLQEIEDENKRLRDSGIEPEIETEEKPVSRKELEEILEKQNREITSRQMVDDFLNENPDFRKIEKRLRKYVNDSDYANIPIGFIASGIVGENIDEEVNKRAKEKVEADKEAELTKLGGSTRRTIPGKKKNVWDMTPEEFAELQLEVLQRGRD